VHGERFLYESPWVSLSMVDVEVPDGQRFEHHVVRSTGPAVGVVVTDPERGVLLLWRHRFMTDEWGWEIPAGAVDPGEDLEVAAAREVLEETGWRVGPLTHWLRWHPQSGRSDQVFEVFGADMAGSVGPVRGRSDRVGSVRPAPGADRHRRGARRHVAHGPVVACVVVPARRVTANRATAQDVVEEGAVVPCTRKSEEPAQ
jgi:8-oxo-dGTP pyrophosphatase MutT (NUDIX family)